MKRFFPKGSLALILVLICTSCASYEKNSNIIEHPAPYKTFTPTTPHKTSTPPVPTTALKTENFGFRKLVL